MVRNCRGVTCLVAAMALTMVAGCRPSASVRRTTPIANLQSYRVVMVRVGSVPAGQGLVGNLEGRVIQGLQQRCSFDNVVLGRMAPNTQADLIVDLNIRRSFRGGEGFMRNPNLATVDLLMVLSDGVSDDLLGSVWIKGKSSGVLTTGAESPEGQAIRVAGEEVVKELTRSGCFGARMEREPDDDPTVVAGNGKAGFGTGGNGDDGGGDGAGDGGEDGAGDGGGGDGSGDDGGDDGAGDGGDGGGSGTGDVPTSEPQYDPKAEAANDKGKALFRTADVAGAVAKFKEAIAISPDPRYYWNLCISYNALKKYNDALAACYEVLERNPGPKLRGKAQDRIQSIKGRQ